MQANELEAWVTAAKAGDGHALEALLEAVQGPVYGLALRMLWHPADAEDATQEILIKVVTHLSQFRGDSSFKTWMFRVATNHLLKAQRVSLCPSLARIEQMVGGNAKHPCLEAAVSAKLA